MNTLADQFDRVGYLRRGPETHDPARPWTEWLHFVVFGAERMVLVNLSFRTEAAAGPLVPRVTLLVWDGAWHGEVDTLRPGDLRVAEGRLDASFGRSRVAVRGDAIHLSVTLERAPLALELRLDPLALPLPVLGAWLGPGARLNWMAVPRLRATGTVRVGDIVHPIVRAPAYHDHNWGGIALQGDFSWEWGVTMPSDAASEWSLLFVRHGDRARTRSYSHSISLVRGQKVWRMFRDGEVSFSAEGAHVGGGVVPREARVLLPPVAPSVPRVFRGTCARGEDRLAMRFEAEPPIRLVMPGVPGEPPTLIHESAAAAWVEGEVDGEHVKFQGPAVLEVTDG